MKKTLVIVMVSIASIALTVGIAKAASGVFDSLTIGKQGVGGVTYFNGTIINNTTTSGADNPVTFGDNVRIDGRVYRGATAGTGDTMPFIVNDNMEVAGDLTVSGTVTAASLQELISGVVSATGYFNATTTTTWTGYIYYYTGGSTGTNVFTKSELVTVTFTPTTETSGTLTSSPYWAFDPRCSSIGEIQPGLTLCTGTFTGTYNIVENIIFAVATAKNGTNYDSVTGNTSVINLVGNKLTFANDRTIPGEIVVLSR